MDSTLEFEFPDAGLLPKDATQVRWQYGVRHVDYIAMCRRNGRKSHGKLEKIESG
jgi:hypothetical protein